MRMTLNGEPIDSRGSETVADLVAKLELPADALLIEHNGLALHRAEWATRRLAAGDRIEFIRVVAGG